MLFTAARYLFNVEEPQGEVGVDALPEVRFDMLRRLLRISALHAFRRQ